MTTTYKVSLDGLYINKGESFPTIESARTEMEKFNKAEPGIFGWGTKKVSLVEITENVTPKVRSVRYREQESFWAIV